MSVEFKMHRDFPLQRPATREEFLLLLDKYFPAITDKIDLDAFDMGMTHRCVMGQTIGWSNRLKMFDSNESDAYNLIDDTTAWKKAIQNYRLIKQHNAIPEVMEIDTEIEQIEAKLKELKQKRQEAITAATKQYAVSFTKAEIEAILERKPAAVREKLEAALKN